ncbi:anaphase-promoting complex subunit cdc27, partial [Coemansia spiralis]
MHMPQNAPSAARGDEPAPPRTEAARFSYEKLIHRGISLLQPHSVLFIAEAYHGWHHPAPADIAGCVLQRTVGIVPGPGPAAAQVDTNCVLDVRSVYWLALCHWHLGEIGTTRALLGPLSAEVEYIIDGCSGDAAASSTTTTTDGSAAEPLYASAGYQQQITGESPMQRTRMALACGMWLLATACTRLEKWQEAEDHLLTLTTVLRQLYAPDEPGCAAGSDSRLLAAGSPGLYAPPTHGDVSDLLALVCLRTNRAAQSEAHSADALQRNPLLWSSRRRLCELGALNRLTDAPATAVELVPDDRTPPPTRKASIVAERTPVPATRPSALSRKLGAALQQASGHRPRRPADPADTV